MEEDHETDLGKRSGHVSILWWNLVTQQEDGLNTLGWEVNNVDKFYFPILLL